MDNSLLYRRLYQKPKEYGFSFDTLTGPKIYQLFTPTDVGDLYSIVTSVRLSSKIKQKYKYIDDIMVRRGFKKFGAGYNRVVYKYLENQSFLAKIAIDDVGITDNPAEFKNQWLIQPLCTKIFDVDQTGVLSTVERVQPITSLKEYAQHYESIFALLNNVTGKYVASDIGCNFFRNIGIREGFGPVLLDFPYIYELDGDKLYCSLIFPNGELCGGEIDFDDGFNNLICKKCGKRYSAKDLSKEPDEFGFIIKKGRSKMRVVGKRGDKIIVDSGRRTGDDVIQKQSKRRKIFEKATKSEIKVAFYGWTPEEDEPVEEDVVEIKEESVDDSEKIYNSDITHEETTSDDSFDANTGFVKVPEEDINKAITETIPDILSEINSKLVNEQQQDHVSSNFDHVKELIERISCDDDTDISTNPEVSLEDRVGNILDEQTINRDDGEKYEAISFGDWNEIPHVEEDTIDHSFEEQAITAPDFPDIDASDTKIVEEVLPNIDPIKEKIEKSNESIPVVYDYIPGSDSKYPAKPKRRG